MGIALAAGVTAIGSSMMRMPMALSWRTTLTTVGATVMIGLLAGFFPARRGAASTHSDRVAHGLATFRTFELAALGAAVTLAALLIAVSVADRERKEALNEIRRMGLTVLTVNAEQSRNRAGRARTGLGEDAHVARCA